jgi:hypothetical protein
MSILSAIKQESSSLDDLAKLPQTLIMQMAQNGQISKEMVAPILGKKAEMADAVARMNAMQQGGQKQSVMEQIMQKNAQGENPIPQIPTQMQEAGVAQIPTREPQYAGGGIVAFANGGMYDREAAEGEESEAEEMARLYPKSKLADLIESGSSGIRGLMSKMPASYASEKAAADMKTAAPSKGNHPYEEDAIKAAKQVGLDPNLMLHALYKESGGLKDPATAKSKAGAYGPMQLMAGTAKDLGVDRTDPYQNILGGATYLKQQVDTFKDPQLALAAYNAGPGALKKALASTQGLASLPRETQGYMKYSAGGDVKGYAAGDYVGFGEEVPYDDSQSWGLSDFFKRHTYGTKEYFDAQKKEAAGKKTDVKPTALPKQTVSTPPVVEYKKPEQTMLQMSHPTDEEMGRKPKQGEFDKLAELLAKREESIAADRAENRGMAILQAGLGMLGGTSPYAMANIGQGAMQGTQAYAQGQKGIREQERDIMSGQLGLAKYKSAAENALADRAAIQQHRGVIEEQGAQRLSQQERQSAIDDLRIARENMEKNLQSKFPKVKMGMPDPAYDKAIQDYYNSAEYQLLLRRAGLPTAGTASGVPQSGSGWSIKPKS